MSDISGNQQMKMIDNAFNIAINAMVCDLKLEDKPNKNDLDDLRIKLTKIVNITTEDGKNMPLADIALGVTGMVSNGGLLPLFTSLSNQIRRGLHIRIGLISINALSIIPLLIRI